MVAETEYTVTLRLGNKQHYDTRIRTKRCAFCGMARDNMERKELSTHLLTCPDAPR